MPTWLFLRDVSGTRQCVRDADLETTVSAGWRPPTWNCSPIQFPRCKRWPDLSREYRNTIPSTAEICHKFKHKF